MDTVIPYLDAFFNGDLELATSYLSENFTFEGPVSRQDSVDEFAAAAEQFLADLHPGWRRIAACGDERQAFVLYELRFREGMIIQIANHLILANGRIARETVIFDTARLKVT